MQRVSIGGHIDDTLQSSESRELSSDITAIRAIWCYTLGQIPHARYAHSWLQRARNFPHWSFAMASAAGTNHRICFRAFELDPHTRELFRSGVRLRLQGHPIDVLEMLLERPGELVTREELRKRLWTEDTFVDFEHSLNSTVARLRDALGDHAEDPKFIETVPRLGYRFVAPVENASGRASASSLSTNADGSCMPVFPEVVSISGVTSLVTASPDETLMETKPRSWSIRWRRTLSAVSSILVFAAVVLLWYARQPLPPPHISATERITNDSRYIAKMVVGTDGARIYLHLGSTGWDGFGQVPVNGGEISRISIESFLGPISPDGASFLIYGNADPKDGLSNISVVGASGSPARLLTRSSEVAWSADGKQVMSAIPKGEKTEIYTIPSVGGEPHLLRVINSPDSPTGFAYSPDGKRIRFNLGWHRLMEMSTDGSNLHEILHGWHPSDLKCCVTWAPDGSVFVFLSAETSEVAGHPAFQVWAIDERRGWLRKGSPEPIQLTFGPMNWFLPAVFTRDGQKILGNGQTWRGELVRYSRKTKQVEPFLGGLSADNLDFSRDGGFIVYAPFPGNTLFRANRDGTEMRQVFSGRTHPMNPRLSPDGRQIAFVEGEFDGPALSYVMPSDGGNPVRIFPENKCCNEVDPTWSPDGKRLAVWVESPQEKIETEMRIVTLATREVSYLPRAPKRAWSPRWSPDGRYILCLTKPYPGTDGLEIYDFKTNKWKILLTEPGSGNWPSWSHDSRWIYYTGSNQGPGNRVKILRISVDGGAPEKIMDLQDFRATGYDLNWYGLDPEDNPLMLRDAGANEVYALTLER